MPQVKGPDKTSFNRMSRDDDSSLSDDMASHETQPSQETQTIDTTSVQNLLEQHKQNLKRRRRQRNEAIKVAHTARMEGLSKAYERAKTQYQETVWAIQRPKLERLLHLIKKKREVLASIDDCVSQKEAAFMGTVHKIMLAADARSAAME
ncbi:hypothetical protein LTR91_006550 [Friedmanniomyces endolithicus]|uniref:Uncharacterized protein n=1 Tax=Friedmanniomyces endolithicus TaxID=329885 RepID=A0A4U0V5K0_9PEZI|nr:hypothetical protein LTS09_006699 [Friedmanniomyces endolithicus]KAK0282851.1 hypothetical protein LTR35_006643 [Friedmanniomyces endolithicus]KAK0297095.1 hypothetical protein LTS00_004374 [Friedmanniomyces endolithicus]KAK0315822.1 hypothetical protein LTR01_001122 [Friedmanniomyces endolithicus]KAK0320697.1 hypothetical protein LTR82_008410 [Friedmanniomyces endolithicus]